MQSITNPFHFDHGSRQILKNSDGLKGGLISANLLILSSDGRYSIIIHPYRISNKITTVNQGIVLQSHLYDLPPNLCRTISDDVIKSKEGVEAIVNAFYKHDPLTIVAMAYSELIHLTCTKRNAHESFRNLKPQFDAHMSRFTALALHAAISDATSALLLLANADVHCGQRFLILTATLPFADYVDGSNSIDATAEDVHYEAVSTISRQ